MTFDFIIRFGFQQATLHSSQTCCKKIDLDISVIDDICSIQCLRCILHFTAGQGQHTESRIPCKKSTVDTLDRYHPIPFFNHLTKYIMRVHRRDHLLQRAREPYHHGDRRNHHRNAVEGIQSPLVGHSIPLGALGILDQPEHRAGQDQDSNKVQELHDADPRDVHRRRLQREVVKHALVEDDRGDHEEREREDLNHQPENHHGLAVAAQTFDDHEPGGAALNAEGEDVAADEELGEQVHAHDRVVFGVHRAGQAPEDHVDCRCHQGGAQQREAVLHREVDDASRIVVRGRSGSVPDDLDCSGFVSIAAAK
jgi:hypothetical protein